MSARNLDFRRVFEKYLPKEGWLTDQGSLICDLAIGFHPPGEKTGILRADRILSINTLPLIQTATDLVAASIR